MAEENVSATLTEVGQVFRMEDAIHPAGAVLDQARAYIGDMSETPPDEASAEADARRDAEAEAEAKLDAEAEAEAKLDAEAEAEARRDAEAEAAATLDPEAEGEQ